MLRRSAHNLWQSVKRRSSLSPSHLESVGYCPTCARPSRFCSKDAWLRDHFLCVNCGSLPRERALMYAVERYYPDFRDLSIHESSPAPRGASARLKRECPGYQTSQYDPSVAFGQPHPEYGYRSEDLEASTFDDDTFDLVITQDVFEHLFHPERGFADVARTLRPGGAHIFTAPLVNKHRPSERCAVLCEDGSVRHLREPEYHGNPIDPNGSLVTMRWGYDICEWIYRSSGLVTTMLVIDNLELGIRAEYIEVLISRKLVAVSEGGVVTC
jgi:SAM-dependent methyltransferase